MLRLRCKNQKSGIFGARVTRGEADCHVSVDEIFKGRHFDGETIVLFVRRYLPHKLSFRYLAEMTAKRGLSLAHITIMRWIRRLSPEFEKRWNRFARPPGRVDKTYVKIKGRWTHLYRAVDKEGKKCLLRDPRQAPELLLGWTSNVGTTTLRRYDSPLL